MPSWTRSIAAALAFAAVSLAVPPLLPSVHAQDATKAAGVKKGGITVTAPWARATPGGAKVAGAYLEITAAAGAEDRLVAARSPVAGVVELHDHIDDAGVMRMRRVENIPVAGTKAVVLKPGGLHLMLMEIKEPLKEGQTVTVTLVFEKAGEVEISVPVRAIGAGGPGGAAEGGRGPGGPGKGSGSGH